MDQFFQGRPLLIGGIGFLFEAMDIAIIAFILPPLKALWGLSSQSIGLLAGSAGLGGMAGAYLGGRLGDRYGRKRVMLLALSLYCLATLGCAFAQDWRQFLVWRLVAGAGTAAEAVIIAPFLIEFVPARVRGRFMGSLGAFIALGYLCAALLGYFIVPSSPNGWRHVLIVAASPILVLIWWRRTLPESPQWLESRGRDEEARAIVDHIEASVTGKRPPSLPDEPEKAGQPPRSVRARDLFGPQFLATTLSIVALFFAIGFSHYAFFTWMPTLLVARGLSVPDSFRYSLAIYAAQIPGYLSAAWLNDAIDARRTIIGYMAASAAASAILTFAASDHAILAGGILLSFFLNGVLAGVYAFVPLRYPPGIRATAQGLAGVATRFASMISPVLIGVTLPTIGFAGIFLSIALVILAGVAPIVIVRRFRAG